MYVCMYVYPGRNYIDANGKEMFLFNDALNTLYFTGIWRQTYGKGPLR